MIKFAHPEYLNALWAIPVLILIYILYIRTKFKLLALFAQKQLHNVLFGNKSFTKETVKFSIYVIAYMLLVVALANPQTGSKLEEVKQVGIDVYICLDVSLSMQAEDLKPNRLTSAKYEISQLIKRLRGDRIGLIVFAGEAFIQFPLTTDYSAANLFLSAVDVGSVPRQGTAIASAIELATKSFDMESGTKRVIIVITDGEDHEGNVTGALDEAVKNDIRIFTIGMGSPQGAPIPVYDNRGRRMGFKKDKDGTTVLSKLNADMLKEIAVDGDGSFYQAAGYQNELDMIFNDLARIEKSEYGSRKITDYEDKYYYFLIPALLLLVLEFFISEKKTVWFSSALEKMQKR